MPLLKAFSGWTGRCRFWPSLPKLFTPTSLCWLAPFTAHPFPCPASFLLLSSGGLVVWSLSAWFCSSCFTTTTWAHLSPTFSLPILLPPDLGFLPIWMSGESAEGEVVEITLRFRELSITVRGPAAQASQLVGDLTRQHTSTTRTPSPTHSDSQYSFVSSAAPATLGRRETREEIERSFSPCPDFTAAGRRLSGSSYSGESRLRRAWRAGQWARATLEGRIHSPNRTEQLDLRSRIYVVLRTDSSDTPRAFSTPHSYFRCIGRLANSGSVSHAFPSEAEARAYCEGAHRTFPTIEA